jgi:methyltransferase family protein
VKVFWETVIAPLLRRLLPRVVVEVGTSEGDTTRTLLELAAELDCVVHTIDPSPGEGFDLDALRERHGDRLVFHRATSIEALPRIERADAVLLDGDHNWYTAVNELRLLGERARSDGRPFPLTFLHDVDWPYGRRDLYYDPDTVPAEYRHPYEQAGIVPGRAALSREGGVNGALHNAVEEGTPRNGVRTALEDFRAETSEDLRIQDVPGFNGLAIVVPVETLEREPDLVAELERLRSPEWLLDHCRRIEHARLATQAQANTDVRRARRAARAAAGSK